MKDFLTKLDNNDTSQGFVDAEDFNSIFNEAENAVKVFQALSLADNFQLAKSIDAMSKATRYVDTGTANTVSLSRAGTTQVTETLIDGMTLMFTPAVVNTGATTIQVKTLTAKPLMYLGVALTAGFLQLDSVYIATYDLTNGWFECEKIINKRNLEANLATIRKQYAKVKLPIAMVDGTNVLTAVQNENGFYELTGALTADAILQIDIALVRDLIAQNNTTGGFNVTVQGVTGAGTTIPNGETFKLYCDGTNVILNEQRLLLAEIEVTGAETDFITFTGLDINKHKSYRLEIDAIVGSAPTQTFIYAGDATLDTTDANYNSQSTFFTGTTVTASTTSSPRLMPLAAAGAISNAVVGIRFIGGKMSYLVNSKRTSVYNNFTSGEHLISLANIKTIGFGASGSNVFAVGTKVRLYRGDL